MNEQKKYSIKEKNQQFSIVGLNILKERDPNIKKNLDIGVFFSMNCVS
jgi:hypothetical protein